MVKNTRLTLKKLFSTFRTPSIIAEPPPNIIKYYYIKQFPTISRLIPSPFIWYSRVNSIFVLLYVNIGQRTSKKQYFFPLLQIQEYNVVINGKQFFDQPVKNYLRTNDIIQKAG